MADSLSVSSISLASAARIAALSLPLPATEQQPTTSIVDSGSSIVVLSGNGLLLSAVGSSREQLAEALAAATADQPETLGRLAQQLVDTFNTVQSLGDVPTELIAGGADDSTVGALLTTLLGQPGAAFLADNAQLASLQAIGIGLQVTPPLTADSGLALQLDDGTFAAALAGDADATAETLRLAAGSLLDLTADIETGVLAAATGQGAASSPLLSALPADVLAGAIETGGLVLPETGAVAADLVTDVAANVGADVVAILRDNGLLGESPGANLFTPQGVGALAAAGGGLVDTATAEAIRLVRAGDAGGQENVPGGPGIVVAGANAPATAAPATPAAEGNLASEVAAEVLRESTARLNLQNQLSAPGLTALRTILDPYYAALVATARLSELAPQRQVLDVESLIGEFPAPVAPTQAYRGIDSQREAAVGVQVQ